MLRELVALDCGIDYEIAARQDGKRERVLREQIAKRRRLRSVFVERAVADAQLNPAEADGGDVVDRVAHLVAPRDGGVAKLHRTGGVERPAKRGRYVGACSDLHEIATRHHECTVPSVRRLTGRYAGSYGYFAASVSSMSTPRPGASPGCIAPLWNEYACGNTPSVSGVWRMYSWIPKLWTLRSKCSAAAMATGLRSVAPCDPVRTWCSSASAATFFR